MAPKQLAFPDVRKLDPDQVVVRYIESIDTLFIHFYGVGQPGVSVQVDDCAYLRVDPSEENVIGIQIESFLAVATIEHPELLSFAQFTEIRTELLQDWRRREPTEEARMELVNSVLGQWSESAVIQTSFQNG